jgi:hypothetical protein
VLSWPLLCRTVFTIAPDKTNLSSCETPQRFTPNRIVRGGGVRFTSVLQHRTVSMAGHLAVATSDQEADLRPLLAVKAAIAGCPSTDVQALPARFRPVFCRPNEESARLDARLRAGHGPDSL